QEEIAKCKLQNANCQLPERPDGGSRLHRCLSICNLHFAFCNFLGLPRASGKAGEPTSSGGPGWPGSHIDTKGTAGLGWAPVWRRRGNVRRPTSEEARGERRLNGARACRPRPERSLVTDSRVVPVVQFPWSVLRI